MKLASKRVKQAASYSVEEKVYIKNLFLLCVLGMALVAAKPVYAADKQQGAETASNTIFVTATRSDEKETDIAASTGKKGADEIALDNPLLQKELLNSIAGVRVTQTGSTIGHMTSIRMPTNTGPYYLFLQDGIPVQSSGFFNHNGLAYTNYGTAGSTEVLKGAGTALYGSDAVAATINVQSIPVGTKKGFYVKPEYGSDGYWRAGIGGGIEIGDNADLSISASHMNSDGWRDHTKARRDEFTLQHVVDLNESNTLKTIVAYNKSVVEMTGSLIGETEFYNNTTSVGDIQAALNSGQEITRKFDFARLSSEWTNESFGDTKISAIAYLRSNRNRYTATWQPNLPVNDSKEKTIGVMLKADITTGIWRNIIGLDFDYTQTNRTYDQLTNFVPARFGSPVAAGKIYDYDVNYSAIAPYLRSELMLTERLKVAAGVRFDRNAFDYTNNTVDGQYAVSSYFRPGDNNDHTFTHVSPKAELSFALTDEHSVYARYANGFRIPQASRLYMLRTNNIAFSLNPETSDTFEIGYKMATERHLFAVSLYQMTINDTIVRRQNAARERYYENGGKTTHKGVEVSLSSRLLDDLTAKVAYSYTKHKYVNDMTYNNNDQAQAPQDTANVRLIYSPSQLQGLSIMLEWEHAGAWWLDDANTKKYGGFNIANIKINYRPNESFSLFVKANNLTNKVYAESASISFGKEKYTPAAPRQFFAGFEYKMGG
jgi:outer membrane receptor protein involved in Fe transport